MSKNLSDLSGRKGLHNNLFDRLGKAAKSSGAPGVQEMEDLAKEFLMGSSQVMGTASFYDFTRPENQGKKAYVCNGTACRTAGTQGAVVNKLEEHFASEELGEMCCLGRCHENSSFHIDGKNYSGDDVNNLKEILSEHSISNERYRVESLGATILTQAFPGVEEYYCELASWFQTSPDALLSELTDSQLRGRGGAGFPMAFKLNACKQEESDVKFIVCNADEGDPGAYSDRYLLEKVPHSVLLGMMLSGYICGSEWGVLYIRAEYPEAIRAVEDAVSELRQKGYIGENILGTGVNFDFKVIHAQGAYICGEETALLSSIEGQRPEVRVRPPYPAQQGLFNKPTVVNNVETLACVPYIIKNGGEAFAALGTEKSKGVKLVCLDGHFNRPGLYEVEMGTPLSRVIHEAGGGFKHPVKAMQIGGPLGGIVPVEKIEDLTIDFESFQREGFLLGHASVVCIPESYPMIDFIQHLFEFTAHESCGKCFPCRLGSKRGAEMLTKAQGEAYKVNDELFRDLLDTLERGSLCALGGGLPLPVKNALHYFEEELSPYFQS